MVFMRDSDTEQGKRLKTGDTIPFETNLFLLAPEREGECIRSSFTDARKVGAVGKRATMLNLGRNLKSDLVKRMLDGHEENIILRHAASESMILETRQSCYGRLP